MDFVMVTMKAVKSYDISIVKAAVYLLRLHFISEHDTRRNFVGKYNLAVNRLLERKEIFADLINGTVFEGRQESVDYLINLIAAEQLKEPERFRTCLQHIFSMLKYNKNKNKLYEYMEQHREEMEQMDDVESMAAFIMLGEQNRIESMLKRKAKEGISVCQAIDELIKEGELRGERRGERRGRRRGEKRGESRGMQLSRALYEDGNSHLIGRAMEDSAFRKEMYLKYQI